MTKVWPAVKSAIIFSCRFVAKRSLGGVMDWFGLDIYKCFYANAGCVGFIFIIFAAVFQNQQVTILLRKHLTLVAALLLAVLPLTRSFAVDGGDSCAVVSPLPGHEALHVVILGDSNTSIGGDDCSNPKGWNKWFKDKFAPATCRSYARSGATWTNTVRTSYDTEEETGVISDDNVVYNQVNRLAEAVDGGVQPVPDLILIAAGTNDAWFAKKRPGAFAKSADDAFSSDGGLITARKAATVVTLAESVRYGCEMLMSRFPGAQIVLLTPLQSASVPASRIRMAGDIIEDCGRRMGLGVIRMDYLGSVYSVSERVRTRRTYDGTHTSVDGARRNGCLVANMVSSMLQY